MDKKDATSEQCWGGGDTVYLQRELGKVLPTALATVVQLQPSDPITVLALWLYKYRELNPLPAVSTELSDTADHADNKHQVTSTGSSETFGIKTVSSLKLVQSHNSFDISGDYLEDSIHLDNAVHDDVIPELVRIGDIFDDNDLG